MELNSILQVGTFIEDIDMRNSRCWRLAAFGWHANGCKRPPAIIVILKKY
jgi:hypothetical protein